MTINYRVRAGGSLIFYTNGCCYPRGLEARYLAEKGRGYNNTDNTTQNGRGISISIRR